MSLRDVTAFSLNDVWTQWCVNNGDVYGVLCPATSLKKFDKIINGINDNLTFKRHVKWTAMTEPWQ